MLAFASVHSLLHFANVFPHFAGQLVTIIVFQRVLGSNLGTLEIQCACHFLINLLSAAAWTLEWRIAILEHFVVFLFKGWRLLSIDVRDEDHARIPVVIVLLLIIQIDHVIVGVINFVSNVLVDFRVVDNNLQISQLL